MTLLQPSGSAPPICLRPVVSADLPLLLTHRNQESTRRWLGDQSPLTEQQQADWFRRGGAASIRMIECGGEVMGLGRIEPADAGEMQVGLDIFEAFRGQGRGLRFFSAVCVEALQKKSRLALWVFRENLPAVAIYRKYGFIEDRDVPPLQLPRLSAPGVMFDYVKMVFGA